MDQKLFFESYLIQMPIHKLARFTMGECIDNVDLRFLKLLLRPHCAVDANRLYSGVRVKRQKSIHLRLHV